MRSVRARNVFVKILGEVRDRYERKLVDHPKDWPWSSFSFYSKLKHGLIRVDPVN